MGGLASAKEPPLETRKVYQLRREASVPETEFGTLQIDSTPAGAEVFIDGQWTGYKTPLILRGVRRGKDHWVKLKFGGYKIWSDSFSMDQGVKVLNANLETK